MAWSGTALLIWLLSLVYEECWSFPTPSAGSFSNSLSLTRSIRSRVQQLLLQYKEEQFGDTHFDDKTAVISTLPSATISYRAWLQMEDTERLYRASRDLQSFWTHLDSQRRKLQDGGVRVASETKKRSTRGRLYLSLPQSILGVQLDLRDLMRQVNSQLLILKMSKVKEYYTHTPRPSATSSPASTHPHRIPETASTPGKNAPGSSASQWESVLEGYVVLRDLEKYLSRLVRDYTLLRAKI